MLRDLEAIWAAAPLTASGALAALGVTKASYRGRGSMIQL